MNALLRRFLCLAAACPLAAQAEPSPAPSPAALPAEAVADFEWFGTLGFPDVQGCTVARVAIAQSSEEEESSDGEIQPPPKWHLNGFLLRHDDAGGRFSVLTYDLFTRDFEISKPGTPEPKRTSYEDEPLATVADACLADLATPRNEEDGGLWRRAGERLSERTEIFTWAWACWRNGLDGRAARFYQHAATMTSFRDQQGDQTIKPTTLRGKLERDLGYSMIWRATVEFGDPKIPRPQLLEAFERVARNYPGSQYAASARETADRLRTMVAEDAAHAAKPAVPLDQLPPAERGAELIFRLRDQNGHQFGQPGECDVFNDFHGVFRPSKDELKSPAHLLVDLGYAAVPQLMAALDDRAFSRSVAYRRDFYFSHHVLTVGDCALQILERIAARGFHPAGTSSDSMSHDNKTDEVKKAVAAWWSEFQQKGEKRTLIDAVVKGGQDAATLLWERYPDDALEPLIQGARQTTDPWARESLVRLAGGKAGNAPVAFLEEEMHDGPLLGARLTAARALWQRGRGEEAVAAMIDEWLHPRPLLRARKPSETGAPPAAGSGMDAERALENVRFSNRMARGELIGFLAGSGRLDAIEALGRGLRKQPVGTRLDVVSAMAAGSVNQSIVASGQSGTGGVSADRGLRRKDVDDDDKVDAAAEALLVAELDDEEQRVGMSGTRKGKAFSDPLVCDFAAEVLAERFHDKYTFDLGASVQERARQRVVCANLWRAAHGEPLLPPWAPRHVDPAPDETILPLLRTLTAPDQPEQQDAARVEITKLGLSALAPVRTFAAALAADDPARQRLETLERSLGCTVVEAGVAFPPGTDDARRQVAQERLDMMKGQPLTAGAFVQLSAEAAGKLSEGTAGFTLTARRDEDFGGVRIVLKCQAAPSEDDDASLNNMEEHISLDRRQLYGRSGSGGRDYRHEAKDYKDFQRAAEPVFAAEPDQPFWMTISLRGH